MENINFQPLFTYFDEQFFEVRHDISGVKLDLMRLKTSIDGIAKMTKPNSEEIVVINSRLENLETKKN